ncbi:MAG: hypothetical protein M9887_08735 [Chitinophagales bacterium]|nr:hypothetical protein [Chitinophagales bacterium]
MKADKLVKMFLLSLFSMTLLLGCRHRQQENDGIVDETAELIKENLGETLPFDKMNDTMQIKHLLKIWNGAHSPKYIDQLGDLYGDNFFFYGENKSKQEALSIKRKVFGKYPTYHQKIIGSLNFKKQGNDEYKVEFTKFATVGQATMPIPSYIVFKKLSPNHWIIVAESDEETDKFKRRMKDSLMMISGMYSPSQELVKGNFTGVGVDTLFVFQDENQGCTHCVSSLFFTNDKLPPLEISSTSPIIVFNERDLDGDGAEDFTVLKNTEEGGKATIYAFKNNQWKQLKEFKIDYETLKDDTEAIKGLVSLAGVGYIDIQVWNGTQYVQEKVNVWDY